MELDSMLTQLVIFGTMAPSTYGDDGQKINYLSAEAFKNGKEIRVKAKELKYGEEPTLEELLKFDEPLKDPGEIFRDNFSLPAIGVGNTFEVGANLSGFARAFTKTGGAVFLGLGAIPTFGTAKEQGDSDGRAWARTIGSAAGSVLGGLLFAPLGPGGVVVGSWLGSALGEVAGAAIYDDPIGVISVGTMPLSAPIMNNKIVKDELYKEIDEAKNAVNDKINEVGDAIKAPFKKVGWW